MVQLTPTDLKGWALFAEATGSDCQTRSVLFEIPAPGDQYYKSSVTQAYQNENVPRMPPYLRYDYIWGQSVPTQHITYEFSDGYMKQFLQEVIALL